MDTENTPIEDVLSYINAVMPSAIARRTNKRVSCKHCGQGDLEWVSVANAGAGTAWRYVPFGTTDLSGKIHALRPEACGNATTQGVTETPDNAVPTAGAAPAPIAAAAPIADALTDARLSLVEQNLDLVRVGLNQTNDTIANMGNAIDDLVKAAPAKVDTSKLEAQIKAVSAEVKSLSAARPVEISVNAQPAVNIGRQHYMMPNLVAIAANVGGSGIAMLQGERGSGKSYAIEPLAKALVYDMDTEVEKYECNPDTSAVEVFGFFNANGVYVPTPFYRAYTEGKLLFVDELPRAMADAIAAINSLTSGDFCGFPNGMQRRHPRFLCIAAGNTSGRGASDDYEGNKLDAATLSRLVYVPWDTDWVLMGDLNGFKITGHAQPFPDPGAPRKAADYADWGKFVKRIADMLPDLGITSSVSARSIINGAKLLAAGVDRGMVEYATIWGHMSEQDAATVKAAL